MIDHAKAISEIGSTVAVYNLLARVSAVSALMGRHDKAEPYYAALLLCRPLWIPYTVKLSEHQAREDIKRAFRTIEVAKGLLGQDFWLVT